jgi:subtilisin family serine protease
VALAIATPGEFDSPSLTCRSPFSDRTATFHRDPATGEKWLETDDGGRFSDVAAFYEAEARAVGEPWCRVDPDLLGPILDPARSREDLHVSVLFREQPLAAIAEGLTPALEQDLARLRITVSELAARQAASLPPGEVLARLPLDDRLALEDAVFTGAEREALGEARDAIGERLLSFRREALALADPLCRGSEERLLARVPEARVTGRSAILNLLWLRLPAGRIPRLVLESPEVRRVEPARHGRYALDVSVPTTNAANVWSAGYTGAGVKVAVIDGGIDVGHPALGAAVTSSKTFHASASKNSDYGDSATNVDDGDGHGTLVAGALASRDSTYRGVGRAASILNARIFYITSAGAIARSDESDCADALRWALSTAHVVTMSVNFGSTVPDGNSNIAKLFDAAVQSLRIPVVIAVGNGGPDGPSIEYPGDAFNVITVGNLDDNDTNDLSDDALASSSGRGPTQDGRLKPDLVAPGTDVRSANYKWEGNSPDFVNGTGSSLSAPHVAGGLALLLHYDGTFVPEVLKALLLNTTANSSPYPTEPNSSWGHGGLDLAAAYARQGDVISGSFSLSGDREIFYTRSTSLSYGDRATLAWSRHLGSFPTSGFPGTPDNLLDLDLYLYDGMTGALAASGTSAVDPVEKVRAPGTVVAPVLRVRRDANFPQSYGLEPFALAAPAGFSTAKAPAFTAEISGVLDYVGPGEAYTIQVKVSNTGGLNAVTPQVTLGLPSGTTVTSGSNPVTLATIEAGKDRTATFTILTSSSSVTGYISATPASTCYGSTWTAIAARVEQEVDAVSPRGSILVNSDAHSTSSRSVTLDLSAWDPDSTVADMRFSTDGTTFGSWQAWSTTHAFTLPEGDGVKTVWLEVRDGEGNVSKKPASDTIIHDTTPPGGTFAVESGNGWAMSTAVTIHVAVTDPGGAAASGWTAMRFRNAGNAFGDWLTAASSCSFDLPGGEGEKTVEAEFRDDAGNVSDVVTVAVGLDLTAPEAEAPVISGDEGWRNYRTAEMALSASDPGGDLASGVESVRFRNEAGAFGAWLPYGSTVEWELSAGNGGKTVSAEFRDRAGNVTAAGASGEDIRLDQVPPTGILVVNESWPYTRQAQVALRATGVGDGDSGVRDFRIGEDPTFAVTPFRDFATGMTVVLSDEDGDKVLHAQIRDMAGNLADLEPIEMVYDRVPPVPDFSVNEDAPYFLPDADLSLLLAAAEDGGSPPHRFKLSWDGGAAWSAWTTADPGHECAVSGPPESGFARLSMVLSDMAGNESEPVEKDYYQIPGDLPVSYSSLKAAGRLGARRDCAAFFVDAVEGDTLTAAAKGKGVLPAIDLVDMGTEETLVLSRWPLIGKPGAIKGLPVPRTGRLLLVVRLEPEGGADAGDFTLSLKMKQAKQNRSVDLSTWEDDATFPAVQGAALSAKFAAPGLTADAIKIRGPGGAEVPFVSGGKPGKISLAAVLDGGTGTYRVEYDRTGLVNPADRITATASIKLPK